MHIYILESGIPCKTLSLAVYKANVKQFIIMAAALQEVVKFILLKIMYLLYLQFLLRVFVFA